MKQDKSARSKKIKHKNLHATKTWEISFRKSRFKWAVDIARSQGTNLA
jgi:hypothetical protein